MAQSPDSNNHDNDERGLLTDQDWNYYGFYNDDYEEYVPGPGEEGLHVHKRKRGPLNNFPPVENVFPAFFLFLLFFALSLIFWYTPLHDELWASRDTVFNKHEWWRAITSIMVHANGAHLLSNAPLFVIFGWLLRSYFGYILFPFIAFLAGISCTLATLFFYESTDRLIGASGMVYAMVALWLVFYVRYDVDHSVPIRIVRALGFSLIIMFPTMYNPEVSYLAHAFGFIFGLIYGIAAIPMVSVIPDTAPSNDKDDFPSALT